MADTIAFIGAGNMAKSLVGGLLRNGHPAAAIVAADPDASQRAGMAALGVTVVDSNARAVEKAASIVLAVKPQVMRSVVQDLNSVLRADQLLISIAAGVPSSALARWSPKGIGIVRCMPNTPALYGAGVTALFANERVTAQQTAAAQSILSAAGHVIWVDTGIGDRCRYSGLGKRPRLLLLPDGSDDRRRYRAGSRRRDGAHADT